MTGLVIGIIAILIIINVNLFGFKKVNEKHFYELVKYIVYFLPFEFIPSIQVGGVRLKLNYIVISICLNVWLILIIRGKIKVKLNYFNYILLLLAIIPTFSLFNIVLINRAFVNYIGLYLCLLAAFFVGNYLTDFRIVIKRLFVILFGCSIFGMYQFVGDMIGLSPKFTFLKEMYTKIVFGIPRIQGTSNEPQLFAGILLLPISIIIFYYLFNLKDKVILNNKLIQYAGILITIVFILTISKGAFLALLIAFGVYIMLCITFIKGSFNKIFFNSCLVVIVLLISFIGMNETLINKLNPIFDNITGTISGNTPTSVERDSFTENAFKILEKNPLGGLGGGQYGYLSNPNNQDAYALIVNNVYLEVWVEYGILFLIVFLSLILLLLYKLMKKLQIESHDYYLHVLLLALLANVVHWYFYSPIYITPIFILFGIVYVYSNVQDLVKKQI
jgi:O-antigen ligase